MNINVSIIDQRVRNLADKMAGDFADRLHIKNDEIKVRSAAFVFLMVKTLLDLNDEETLDTLTEGGQDFGVDALEISDIHDCEFTVTLFQAKYAQDLEGTKNFPENGVTKAIQAVRKLFDPKASISANKLLTAKLEEIRSLIQDGNLPRVRFVLCNNGLSWTRVAQNLVDQESFPESVQFEHANHDTVVRLLQSTKSVKETLRFHGKSIVEDFNFIRVFVGKLPVTEVAELLARNGDRLLERNIRRYLGLGGNRVNDGIKQTLLDPEQRPSFYFYNNGLTLTCNKFDYNALQAENHQVKVEGLQIINGGQTCKTIEATLNALNTNQENLDKAYVMVRLYQLPDDGTELVRTITYATNSQNPVDLRDLRSNDERQRALQSSLAELGYNYRRQRSEDSFTPADISSATAAEAVLSVWRQRPHQAKAMAREHFGKLYDLIFTPQLIGTQLVVATLLFRLAENVRKRPPADAPAFLPYASHYMAMVMGELLLKDLSCPLEALDHRKFKNALDLLEKNGNTYVAASFVRIELQLKCLAGGGTAEIPLQRLSAIFRRSDLVNRL